MKYKILKELCKEHDGKKVYRIIAAKDFVTGSGILIKSGTIGGYIADYNNLSQDGNCWVSGDAVVRDNAEVFDDAEVKDNALVCGYAVVCDNVIVCENAVVCGYAVVCDNVIVCENAVVCGTAIGSGTGEIGGDVKIG